MLPDAIIEFKGVGKQYRRRGGLFSLLFRNGPTATPDVREFWALRDISFAVPRGEVLGIIGPNGAGKSTILKLLAGVTVPDAGELRINGRIAPLIELGAGFHPELSGRENVYLNGALLGLTRREIDARYDEIVEFAELADFMDSPVKQYSSGMFVRLAFSLAVHTDPDVLLIDEVLSVGDERFQRKCLRKFAEFRRAGKTIIVVSHDLGMVSGLCSNVMLMSAGEVVASGPVDGVIGRYLQMVGEGEGVGVLQRGDLTLMFNSGRGSLFRGGREITKKLGLYTSMLISSVLSPGAGIWHDSTRAIWTCATSGGNRLRARGEFISVPLVQEWEFELGEDGRLHWQVVLEVLETVRLERHQANAMLSEAYRRWNAAADFGDFPEEFTSRDYHNWEVLASLPCGSMIAKGETGLPDLEFRTITKGNIATVVNSNFFFSGRVLMFLDLNAQELPPGRYPYFEGELMQNAS
jgi:ABC-type polysaccharide/polyol phosphate transport system ATPase subunit